ncbi:hypothetical protein L596_003095 [Steinernema carpocapsae]|uniref:Amino acid permease/ SLC12A domain-containing protein n=1 Tax=Steinernema carpocapsae TaxID=34508 RepID=A0A4U8URE6_STECR|nr:hypothetical protein L596_003095 [Steinernema carpocapsae]
MQPALINAVKRRRFEGRMGTTGPVTIDSNEPEDSLFAHEQRGRNDDNIPWWQRNLLLNQPVLFGTWDGVFTTVMVNIFGIIIFLRMGWIVGTAGIASSVLLLIICTVLSLISVFSAVGICERCQIQSGGIYFLVSHVLGGQIGGAIGIMYAFGQAVATGLVAVGFGESMAGFFESNNRFIIKVISISVLVALTVINAAGVRWVIRLQLVLLAFLVLAVVDFFSGALFSTDADHGVGHFSTSRFSANWDSQFEGTNCTAYGSSVHHNPQSFFTVFGVFFANFLGVLAGVNMSGDLKDPHKSIPLGELSAVGVSSFTCFLFIIVLGAVVDRGFLLCDTLINERVSLTGFLFLTGLYISSLSSVIGSLLGTPRVIQSIAAEGIVPSMGALAQGHGPNKNPVLASVVIMGVAVVFVLLGDLNQLAILSTMPFLITYAFVNYSYVSLAMSYDFQAVKQLSDAEKLPTSYGSMGNIKGQAGSKSESDLDQLFPERTQAQVTLDGASDAIVGQPQSWYSMFSNRYTAFIGAIVNIVIILFVNFWVAVIHFVALALLYFYIGRVCPSVFQGITQFSLSHMFKTALNSVESIGASKKMDYVLSNNRPDLDVETARLNDENEDYSTRKQYHHAEHVQEFD